MKFVQNLHSKDGKVEHANSFLIEMEEKEDVLKCLTFSFYLGVNWNIKDIENVFIVHHVIYDP